MDRIKQLANAIYNKDIIKIESEPTHNSFYNESDKNIIRTFIGSLDSRERNQHSTNLAFELCEKLLELNPNDSYYQKRYQALSKHFKGFE
jgi:regulator of sirC expression with transglutaminase-like and TPR domain